MQKHTGTIQVKRSFPEMLKGGVTLDGFNLPQLQADLNALD
jgi:pyridoxal biosynthesis lyase PdxS